MNIGCYCRVSTDTEDQLNSLQAQKGFFEEYARKQGHILVKVYADEGISGTKSKNRKEFLKLMRDAEQGLFSMVVVKDISRFARNTVDLLTATRKLKALEIETLFLTNNMTVLGNSEFVLTVFGALAQEESANTSKRVKFGKKRNAEQGRVPNLVYGYDKRAGDYFHLDINPQEADVVRRIFVMYVHEGYGALKIAQLLNQEGIKTKRHCNWSQNAIARILKNQIYVGKIINGKQEIKDFLTGERTEKQQDEWIITHREELRIVEDDLYDAAQKTLQQRIHAFAVTKQRQSNKHLFSTLIKCQECGWSFRRMERTYKNTYVRWVCSGRNGRGSDTCHNTVAVDEGELMDAMRDYFTAFLARRQHVVQHVLKEFKKTYRAKQENQDYEQELRVELSKLKKTREKYMDMYEDDLISREEMRGKMQQVNQQKEKAAHQLGIVTHDLSQSDQLEEMLQNTFQTIQDIVSMEHVTNAQLKKVIQKIVVDPDATIHIYIRLFRDIGLDDTILIHDNDT